MSGTDLKGVVYFAYLIFRSGHVSQHKALLITCRPMPGNTELRVAKFCLQRNVSEYLNLICPQHFSTFT